MSSQTSYLNLTLHEVLDRYQHGPQSGVFVDGGCKFNPGPGGWGVVYVESGKIIDQRHGHTPSTTNNRMELTAIIEAYKLLDPEACTIIYSDSNLCVRTLNEWAASWEQRRWRRKTGEIANLELVQEAYELFKLHPRVEVKWVKAHCGYRWNEYADSLANAWDREEL